MVTLNVVGKGSNTLLSLGSNLTVVAEITVDINSLSSGLDEGRDSVTTMSAGDDELRMSVDL